MTAKKKIPAKVAHVQPEPQEPPADQPQPEEPVRPMGVQEPTLEERVNLLEYRFSELEKWSTKHEKYHFGGTT